MKELKFRAWDKIHEKYREPMVYDILNDKIVVRLPIETLKKGEFLLEQYTGLKDKNGKEIYEGDILKDKDYVGKVWTCKVEYDDNFARFYCDTNYSECWSFEDAKGDELEVIGNIHEREEEE